MGIYRKALFFSAETLCDTYEDEVYSHYPSTRFSIGFIDTIEETIRNAKDVLHGSQSFGLINPHEYLYITDFIKDDHTPGSLDLVSLSFTVNPHAHVVCQFFNSFDDDHDERVS